MIESKYKIEKKVTKNELTEIKRWLKKESTIDKGFYHNWDIIENANLKNEIFIIKKESEVVGFLVWTDKEICAEIDIFEIKPEHRRKGIGEFFYVEFCKYLRQHNFCVVRLFCEPKESEKFWIRMNFIKFPDIKYSIPKLTYYKPLIEINKPTTEIDNDNKLELWNCEPHEIKNNEPKWSWNIDAEIFYPILNPYNPNWYIRLTKKGKIVKEEKVKRFDNNREIEFGSFIYIKEPF